MKIPVTRPDENGLAIIAAQSARLDGLVPIEAAAHAYHAAWRVHRAAASAQDRAFKAQAENTTYGTVQKWQDALAAEREAAETLAAALAELARVALTVPEVF